MLQLERSTRMITTRELTFQLVDFAAATSALCLGRLYRTLGCTVHPRAKKSAKDKEEKQSKLCEAQKVQGKHLRRPKPIH